MMTLEQIFKLRAEGKTGREIIRQVHLDKECDEETRHQAAQQCIRWTYEDDRKANQK